MCIIATVQAATECISIFQNNCDINESKQNKSVPFGTLFVLCFDLKVYSTVPSFASSAFFSQESEEEQQEQFESQLLSSARSSIQ